MAEFASNGKANAGLATGIIGTTLGGLLTLGNGTGLLGGIGGNNMVDSRYVSKDDLNMAIALAQKDSEIALLKSEQNTEIKIADVYERVMTRVNADRREQDAWNTSQSVANAQMSAAIAANATSIASLQNCCNQITMLKVPNSAVCPGWGQVTVTPANGTTV